MATLCGGKICQIQKTTSSMLFFQEAGGGVLDYFML